jgi:hypothetical protein
MEEGSITKLQLKQLIDTDINSQISKGCHALIWHAKVPKSIRAEFRQKGIYSIFKRKSTSGSKTIFTWEREMNFCKECENDFHYVKPYESRGDYGWKKQAENKCAKCSQEVFL